MLQMAQLQSLGKWLNDYTRGAFSDLISVTMTCSSAATDQKTSGQAGTPPGSYQRPAYTIAAQYPQTVDSWIQTFPQDSKKPTTITFKASDASSSSWQELGYSNDTVQVTGSYSIFFSATYTENGATVTKNVTAEEAGADLEVTITATHAQSFAITPGSW